MRADRNSKFTNGGGAQGGGGGDRHCRCGAHSASIPWTEELRRAAGIAFGASYYQDFKEVVKQLTIISVAVPEECDTDLAVRLRNWNPVNTSRAECMSLAHAVGADSGASSGAVPA